MSSDCSSYIGAHIGMSVVGTPGVYILPLNYLTRICPCWCNAKKSTPSGRWTSDSSVLPHSCQWAIWTTQGMRRYKNTCKKTWHFWEKDATVFGTAQRLWVFDSSRYLEGEKRREEKKLGTAQKNPLSALNFLFGEFKAGPKIWKCTLWHSSDSVGVLWSACFSRFLLKDDQKARSH